MSDKRNKPTVFLSSTCYDLGQIRLNLRDFLEDQLGYEVMMSEQSSFPIDPDKSTLDNCLGIVRDRADILVLVIGGRYGSIPVDKEKSITNLEYLEAKNKGIPIYAFVLNNIINYLTIWKDNPNGNYNSIVDSVKLFEFVESLRYKENIWVYGFNNAQDIVQTLRLQFAYLFNEGLILKKQVQQAKLSKKALALLQGKALRIALEKTFCWEHKLLAQLMTEGLEEGKGYKWDLKYGLNFIDTNIIYNNKLMLLKWLEAKVLDIQKANITLKNLFALIHLDNFADSELINNIDLIIYTAERINLVYKQLLSWALDCRVTEVDNRWKEIMKQLPGFINSTIENIECFINSFSEALQAIPDIGSGKVHIEVNFDFQKLNDLILNLIKYMTLLGQ